ncbi:acyloxyacyl hydrolase [Desulfogranum mediterraneum]|uniref:acyloxyacyl hydrolase n=1 Tax=Desulfogranum mediterraneum TaxID=160661 RepID=UPI0009FBF1C8|nr:acyloxyacyl hydrolase [Desulfogranum mediterraneum]
MKSRIKIWREPQGCPGQPRPCTPLQLSTAALMLVLPLLLTLLLTALSPSTLARAAEFSQDSSRDRWALLGGYGQSFPGWGRTTQRVETIDLVPRYRHIIFDQLGSGWYRGFHSILVEAPLSVVLRPEVSAMVAVNFLAAYTFTAHDLWQPYLFGGGGPVYSFADIPGMGADLNGNYQFGLGLEYRGNPAHRLLLELRYHHISNAGSKEPNEPLNSCKLLLGITF